MYYLMEEVYQGVASSVDPFFIFIFQVCFCYSVLSAPCSLVITCREKADLLDILCVIFPCVLSFSIWCLWSGVVLNCIDSLSLPS